MQSNLETTPAAAIEAHNSHAVTLLSGRAASRLVLLCDHASNALPEGYGALGLSEAEFERHIAYDIGAAGVTRLLAESLGCPAVLTRYSRLLIDCNRGTDDPTLIMRLSDGAIIPGNRTLSDSERTHRITTYYAPYHGAIRGVIDGFLAAGIAPLVLSIHSFTPRWRAVERPWHAGVLWDKDDRLAARLLSHLRCDAGFVIGDNEPYSGRLKGDTLWQHGTSRGLPHAIIEIRQDLIATEAGQREWARRLFAMMTRILENEDARRDLNEVRFYGSHADEPALPK